ncbi:hypothetical protein K1720_08480 [Thermococcus argininiproducens]|uniref:DUF1911 domain-containing protein n=1 Tax=Thermococcus argininiproducens TaxID=2866384 RepID=A0A9E7M9S2_9EURY|nr:hypothetical protein [Thermococcus argininiproducens]USG99539.1 hypothetical protein K1720_08480 [Thermococcus argininiproducens]
MSKLMVYVCGNGEREYWEHAYKAKELILKLSESLISMENALQLVDKKSLDYLLQEDILKEESGQIKLNFCFTPWEDVLKLREIGVKYGEVLAEYLIKNFKWVDNNLKRLNCLRYSKLEYLHFAVVGCYALDLKFLTMLENEWGENRKFIPYAREIRDKWEEIAKDFYWGCHSAKFGNYMFYSFGNHTGSRNAFPDLVWSGKARKDEAEALGKALEEFHKSGKTREILERYEYVGVPFFDKHDMKIPWQVADRIASDVEKLVTEEKWEMLKEDLNKLKASQWCAFGELFIEAWHWIFGWANNVLIREGYFAEPEESEDGGRCIKWVSFSA